MNLDKTLRKGVNILSDAWEYSLPFFSEEDLEKWFIDLIKYSPEKRIKLITFFDEQQKTHASELVDGELSNFYVVKTLFWGEYSLKWEKPEKHLRPEESPEKYSPALDRTFQEDSTAQSCF